MSKGFRDFPVGRRFTTPRRTVTESLIDGFAGLTGDYYPLHTDEVFAQGTEFGKRVAHGPLVYSLAIGLMFQAGVFEDAIVAFLGVDELRHTGPCFVGDTIVVEGTVEGMRPTHDGRRGVVHIRYDVTSVVDDRELMTGVPVFLMQGERPSEDLDRPAQGATI